MNEIDTSTLEGKIAVMTAYANGGKLQYYYRDGSNPWINVFDHTEPSWDWGACDYRIKPLEFPKLPEGMEWHNPAGLTPEQVGEEWRLLVTVEADGKGHGNSQFLDGIWSETGEWFWDETSTIRVPISTPFPEPPKPKVMVPLEPHDISPTDVLRKKDRKDFYAEHWVKIDAVNCDGPAMHFAGSGRIRIPFKTLMNEWEISRDGAKTWKPCEKESAS